MHGAGVKDMSYRGERGETGRRSEVSGVLLSWRDDPEKSGVQNGLPGKEVYPTGRRRRRRRGGGGEGCRCSFVTLSCMGAGEVLFDAL